MTLSNMTPDQLLFLAQAIRTGIPQIRMFESETPNNATTFLNELHNRVHDGNLRNFLEQLGDVQLAEANWSNHCERHGITLR